jgi:hypothetical protein
MPREWETFYFMIGSSSAGLIGLLFVVVTLSGDIDATKAARAQGTFLTPTVFHFITAVIISAAAVMPGLHAGALATAIALPAIVGFGFAAKAMIQMFSGAANAPHWSDYLFYGALPSVIYVWLIASAWGTSQGASIAYTGVGVGVLALLLLGIRDAWDLVTWLAFHRHEL